MQELPNRFQDKNLQLTYFQQQVVVHCPKCNKKALATVDYEIKKAKLFCSHCGCYKEKETLLNVIGFEGHYRVAASDYFEVELWYLATFKNEILWAYNEAHLLYLEQYIAAKLRQSNDRKGFTLLEKLPKFYHDAKNRNSLLKVITQLKNKSI